MRHNKHTPRPTLIFSPCSTASSPDPGIKTSKAIPAFWGEKKESGTKRGGDCLLRNLVGSGP